VTNAPREPRPPKIAIDDWIRFSMARRQPDLQRFPAKWNHFADKETRRIK
jgi:hypothetical protein